MFPTIPNSASLSDIPTAISNHHSATTCVGRPTAHGYGKDQGTSTTLNEVVLPMGSKPEEGEESDGCSDHGNEDGEHDGISLSKSH